MYSVLYVDDEEGLLDLGKVFLETMGEFRVDITTSATEALPRLGTTTYDAIISDYQMPVMDGIDFLRAVRSTGNDIPFILFTGRGREEVVIRALNEGADFYLQKGGDPTAQFAELAHKIRIAIQRRQAVVALEESEHRYREVVETQTEFISRFLPDGTHVFVNDAYCRYFKKQRQQIVGHRFIPPLPPEDRERVRRHLSSLTPDHPTGEIEHRVILPDGSVRWNWWSDRALFDRNGRVIEYQSAGKDITDQKQAEEALRASENHYRAIFNFTLAATCIIGPDTILLKVNASWEKLCGYTRGEAENHMSWTQFIHKDDLERLREYHIARRKDPDSAPRIYECRVVHRSGTIHYCLTYVDVIPETKNSIASLLDITERKNAELELQKSETLYRTIFDYTGAASIIIGPDTTILRANAEWVKMSGVSREEQENQLSWTVFFAREEMERMRGYHYARRNDPADVPNVYESRFIDKKGTVHNVFVHVGMIPGTLNSVASLVDITERRRAEDDLRAAYEKLSAAEEKLRAQFEELKSTEQMFRHIIENMQDAYIRADMQGIITMVNPAAARMFGYHSVGDMRGVDAKTLYLHPGDRDRLLQVLREAGGITNFSGRTVRKDGTTFLVSLNVQLLRDEKGRVTGTEAIVRDMTG